MKQQCVANSVSPVVRRTFLFFQKIRSFRRFTKGGTKPLVCHEKATLSARKEGKRTTNAVESPSEKSIIKIRGREQERVLRGHPKSREGKDFGTPFDNKRVLGQFAAQTPNRQNQARGASQRCERKGTYAKRCLLWQERCSLV